MAGMNGMEMREGGNNRGRYESDDVIVISPSPMAWTRGVDPPAPAPAAEEKKLFYKTRMCDAFVMSGRCMHGEGCTFAHGAAEIRSSLTAVAGGWIKPEAALTPPPAQAVAAPQGVQGGGQEFVARASYGGGGGGGGNLGYNARANYGGGMGHEFIGRANYGGGGGHRSITKVCFEFRDLGRCRFGASCAFPHVSAAEIRQGSRLSYSSMTEPPARANMAVTVPRTFISVPSMAPPPLPYVVHNNNGNGGDGYGGLSMMPPAHQPEQEGRKLTRLEILSRKKMSGIYGDWMDGYVSP
uniref:C3H1-type domain-containing protein n=1 Tax=Leersia perrieri TaxID=77586 RepID=A0A0D9UXE2_9ORYZ